MLGWKFNHVSKGVLELYLSFLSVYKINMYRQANDLFI